MSDGLDITIHPVAHAYETDEGDLMRLEVEPEYTDALLRIENRSRLSILFWMHELDPQQRQTMQVHPMGNRNVPLHGVFAVRSPMRPNPVGVTEVNLVRREGNSLYVRGLDAHDGSPIIDIKSGRGEHS